MTARLSRDLESHLAAWSVGPSKTEEEKMERAEAAVRAAISESPKLGAHDIEVIATGSYKNRTHVSGESDVDIAVIYHGMFYSDWRFVDPNAKHDRSIRDALQKRAGLSDASYPDDDYKADVEAALVAKFGRAHVVRGDKAFDVNENTYRVEADVVAAFEHRRWHDSGGRLTYIEGTQFVSDSGMRIINWPTQQNANGIAKHQRTSRRYKKLVRILKNLRNEMHDAGIAAAAPVPSFLSECLIWNVPDDDFDTIDFVTALKLALLHLTVETSSDERCHEWGEESELKYLFRPSQPWTRLQVFGFVQAAYSYVGF